jgi:hypothetical protein
VSVRDRCTVCTKRAIGSETILDAPNDTPRWRGLSAQFSLFGHSANLNEDRCTIYPERTIGSEIILDAAIDTPRLQGSSGIRFSPFGDSASLDAR